MEIRSGSIADLDLVMGLFDEAVAWLVEQGRPDQWGSQPFSGNESTIGFVRKLIDEGDLFVGEIGGDPVGALIVNPVPMHYVPRLDEPELYLRLLITSRRWKGQGIGGQLIALARAEAERRGTSVLRVDCYASPDEALVGYYESQGFTRTERIEVKAGVSVQVFEWRPFTESKNKRKPGGELGAIGQDHRHLGDV